LRKSPWEPGRESGRDLPRYALRLLAIGLVVVVGAVLVTPKLRDAWTTFRTGTAPDSREVVRAADAGHRLVAIGYMPRGDTAIAGAWVVDDGRWSGLGDVAQDRLFSDVVVNGDRVVVVGARRGIPTIFEAELGDAAAWRVAWTHPSRAAGELTAVAATPAGIVAVGATTSDAGRTAIAVSSSADGWRDSIVADGAWLTAVTSSGDDIIAVGQDEATQTASVWRRRSSTGDRNGETQLPPWDREALPKGEARRSYGTAGAATPGRVVVVGQRDSQPTAWSNDGVEWVAVSLGGGSGERATAVEVSPQGEFLAAGTAVGLGDTTSPIAWKTDDGATWTTVTATGANYGGLVDVIIAGDRLVAIGNSKTNKRITPEILELRGHVLARR
jgi:hypothetical protein